MDAPQLAHAAGFFKFLDDVRSENGVVVLTLLTVIGFLYFNLSKLTWKVWSTAMQSKDREIARLLHDRDEYRALVFERLRTLESQSARTLKMRAAGAADHTTTLDEVH
jgi:hypothetical protein